MSKTAERCPQGHEPPFNNINRVAHYHGSWPMNGTHLSTLFNDRMAGGRLGEETPLCASYPDHRGNKEGYPVSIQSFILLTQGERNNSAHHDRSSLTPLSPGRPLCASSSLLISVLSPGACHRCTDVMLVHVQR